MGSIDLAIDREGQAFRLRIEGIAAGALEGALSLAAGERPLHAVGLASRTPCTVSTGTPGWLSGGTLGADGFDLIVTGPEAGQPEAAGGSGHAGWPADWPVHGGLDPLPHAWAWLDVRVLPEMFVAVSADRAPIEVILGAAARLALAAQDEGRSAGEVWRSSGQALFDLVSQHGLHVDTGTRRVSGETVAVDAALGRWLAASEYTVARASRRPHVWLVTLEMKKDGSLTTSLPVATMREDYADGMRPPSKPVDADTRAWLGWGALAVAGSASAGALGLTSGSIALGLVGAGLLMLVGLVALDAREEEKARRLIAVRVKDLSRAPGSVQITLNVENTGARSRPPMPLCIDLLSADGTLVDDRLVDVPRLAPGECREQVLVVADPQSRIISAQVASL